MKISKSELRAAFKRIQEAAALTVSQQEWRSEVDKIALKLASKRVWYGSLEKLKIEISVVKMPVLSAQVLPSEWLKAAELATVTCPKCHGTGQYRWGVCENGNPPKHSGVCFGCEGKGRQDKDDFFRNQTYWRHVKVF